MISWQVALGFAMTLVGVVSAGVGIRLWLGHGLDERNVMMVINGAGLAVGGAIWVARKHKEQGGW